MTCTDYQFVLLCCLKKKKRRHALPLMCGKKSHSIIFFCWLGQPKIVRFFLFLCYFLGDKNKRESPPLRNCNGFSLSLLVREHTRTHGTDSSDKTQFFLVAIAEKEAGFCVCVDRPRVGGWVPPPILFTPPSWPVCHSPKRNSLSRVRLCG